MPSVLITTSSFDLDAPEISALKKAGFTVVMNPHARRVTEEELGALLTNDFVGLIAGVEPITQAVLKKSSLRVVSRCGAGLDNVDMKAAESFGIVVRNTPDAPAVAVAELTIGLILSALRHIPMQDASIRKGGWDRPMGALLGGKTLGLIGYGRIGRKVADIARAFGAKIAYHDPIDEKSESFTNILSVSDILSLHVPYSEENKNLIDARAISSMKKGAVLINAARGGLVDENAVAVALKSGQLSVAAFDVFEQEPYLGELKDLNNVVLTPHVGSYAKETRAMQEAEAAHNLLESLNSIKTKEKANA